MSSSINGKRTEKDSPVEANEPILFAKPAQGDDETLPSPPATSSESLLTKPAQARPTRLPEFVEADPAHQVDTLADYDDLPPLPTPYYDILGPQTHQPELLLPPPAPPLIDFLATEKALLSPKLPLETADIADNGKSSWQTFTMVLREIGETIILTLIIFFLIQLVIRNFRVVGSSMNDNLHNGQYLIIDKLSYSPLVTELLDMGGIRRGDVIVFEPPHNPNDDYVKRIIGLPGETVEVINGRVFINNVPLEEPFNPRPGSYNMPPTYVEEGYVLVLGDNRNNSNDSHNWGTLPVENIVGRAWISYWPPSLWGTIPRDQPTEEATLKALLGELVPSANAEGNTP